jgi:hypothetical protein
MGIVLRQMVLGCLFAGLTAGAVAQNIAITEPSGPLLPASFGEWKAAAPGTAAASSGISLASVSKDALEECGPQRSQVGDYTRGGKTVHMEAIQFADRTGAFSAFTLVERPGMREAKDLGSRDAVGNSAVLFTVGSSLVLVGGATAADVDSLKPLALVMPKAFGEHGVAPLLPSLLPPKGLVNGSLRYAIGAAGYAAEGGVLPAQSLRWDKSAEAVTAQYADKRGKETLTVLLYPTPMIAGQMTKQIQAEVPGMGPSFAGAKVRREGELVILATGGFTADAATQLVGDVHLRQQVSFDQDIQPTEHQQIVKTYSMLASIAILGGVLMVAAVLLGFFLGGGRAAIRMMRGKDAAADVEFLSLHLAPQNKAAQFDRSESPPQA